ncbi:hemerythrin domain-containing protein [Paraburkholderia bannensis]|uniref:hemerythrin domain-containing protein n=1 Tax=Paraburkholderia bannensis TaxID=765414 RepID=UPI002AB64491|nr:hemerythrin domain-containing protein [Paraburkholderia bannensis]
MSLIDTLKHDHKEIFRLLDESRALGISTDEGRRKLAMVRGTVLAHLQREDTRLYPALYRHEQTRELGETYAAEMRSISSEVLQFFDSLEKGVSGLDFARQMGRVVSHLQQRMTREEVRLYPAYERYCD